MILLKPIEQFISNLQVDLISKERKDKLKPLVEFISHKVASESSVRLNFICTHNSRRSILSQVWAQAFACYFKLNQVQTYSGGTSATAVYPLVIETLENIGFQSTMLSTDENPVYAIKFAKDEPAIIGFSKKYDTPFNPTSGFAAIMTCSQADDNCPFIEGAEKRIPITFEDPKSFDNSPQQTEKYSESSLQIATELFYVFSQLTA